MISSLRKYIKKELFNPSILGIFLNPFYFARKSLYKNIKDLAPNCKGKILDVGCGNKPYKNLFIHSNQYVGLEINRECKFADYFYDGSTFPFPDFCYDAVFSSQVLEHVLNPEEFINEIYRVLLPGGMLLLTTPFIWDEHAQPYDYRRYTSFGIRDLLEKHGFEVIEVRKSLNDFRIIAQSLNIYIRKHLQSIPP